MNSNDATPPIIVDQVRIFLSNAFAKLTLWLKKPPTLRAYRPELDHWSIDQILHHITLTNHFLLLLIEKGSRKSIDRYQQSSTAQITNLSRLEIIDRPEHHWSHPSHMTPDEQPDLEKVQDLLEEQKQRCLHLLEYMKCGEGEYYAIRMSFSDLGKVNMYEWLYFLGMHMERHIRQMQNNERQFSET